MKQYLQLLIFLPCLFQLAIFFVDRNIYPFSKNEMYAGHPSPENFQVVYFIGIQNGHEILSRSDFLLEILTPQAEAELNNESPDYIKICDLLARDLSSAKIVDSIRIEKRSWNHLSKDSVLKPDTVRVLHECQLR